MPCSSNDVARKRNVEVADLAFRHVFTAGVRFEPQDKPELVAAVAEVTRNGRSLRALGSNWSFSSVGMADDVLDTSSLRMFVSQPCPLPSPPLPPGRIRGPGSSFLAQACARESGTVGRAFVHVEAGIKIKDLLADLGGCGLSLPTMGDGAGQSLIGALSTATHGGDFRVPPLVEWIRAAHLVGPAGQEWWITPSASPFGDPQLASTLPHWCPDTHVVSDDDAFNAVRVGVGRMGVIYAVILEVVPAYTLLQVNLEHRWTDIRAQLASSSVAGGSSSGIFDAPLADLDTGWFRTEVLLRSVYPESTSASNARFSYVAGPPRWSTFPTYFDSHPEIYVDVLADLRLTGLAADLRGGVTMPLHHLDLVISLSTTTRCWIRRRWKRSAAVRAVALGPEEDSDLVKSVKANKTNPPGIVAALKDQIELDCFLNFLGWITLSTKKDRLDWYLDTEIKSIAADHAAHGLTSGEALLCVIYKIATDPVLEAGREVASIASNLIGQVFGKLARAGPASGSEHQNMLDAHDYGLDGAQAGDSVEFHFDASSGVYLDFIDAVVALASVHFPVFGYIGLRFTPAATALIAMQQFPLTASVEVSTPRTRLQDFYAGFWNDVHDAANTRGGIAHWGQELRQSAGDLAARYGDRLVTWRGVLTDLAADGPAVFSTAFSRDKGLEPIEPGPVSDDYAIDQFLLGLDGGVDVDAVG